MYRFSNPMASTLPHFLTIDLILLIKKNGRFEKQIQVLFVFLE